MNNLKKIGLTAIAASLASVSAHAVDLSVSGGASLSYTSNGNGGLQCYRVVRYVGLRGMSNRRGPHHLLSFLSTCN